MIDHPISRAATEELLLRLYRGSTEVAFTAFQDWSLDLLGEVVRFDAAWWGKASAQPAKILSAHLFNADASLLDDYRRIDGDDYFRDAMIANPGRTINIGDLVSRKDFERSAIYLRYGRKHRIESAVGTTLFEPVSSMVDFLTLWRFDPRWPFSENDRLMVERITPHLVEANRISRLVSLQGVKTAVPFDDPIRPWALADRDDGSVVDINGSFVALLKREWPDWSSTVLPAELLRHVKRRHRYSGESIVVEVSDVDGFVLLVARARQSVDRLGRREAQVLKLYASGESYRRIAERLGTAPATVRNQLARIYRKFGVHNKVALIGLLRATSDMPEPVDAPAHPGRARPGSRSVVPSQRPEGD